MTNLKLIEIEENQKADYNRFIASQVGGIFLQSWDWGQWQQELGNAPSRFCLVDEAGQWRAAGQALKMPLPFGRYYLYLPYGPVIAGGENFQSFDKPRTGFSIFNFQSLLKGLQQRFPDAVFIRIEPTVELAGLNTIARKSTNIQPAITMVVDLDVPAEQLLRAMHPKTRYNIKIAERDGVIMESELAVTPQHGLYIKDAVDLIVATQRRQDYRGHSGQYYHKLINFFALHNAAGAVNLRIYRALYQRQLLACGIMVDFGKTRMYLFGGSSDEHRNVMAPYALHWQAMLDAKAQGLTMYDLGGSEVAGGGEKGFTRFKRGFGGRVVNYAGAYDVFERKLQYHGYRALRTVNRVWLRLSKVRRNTN